MKSIITSGYFNPLHTGHISYLNEAKKLGDRLIVIVNNDEQVKLKGSKPFMEEQDRLKIIENLKCVDIAISSKSSDKSVCEDLRNIRLFFPYDELIFAKGGDRTIDNIPEVDTCKENDIIMTFDVGCKKVTSSSDILKRVDEK
jgi:cytidyltransferase-like protein